LLRKMKIHVLFVKEGEKIGVVEDLGVLKWKKIVKRRNF